MFMKQKNSVRIKKVNFCCSTMDNSLMSNIQKLFSEKIEIFSKVEFNKVSVLTGIIKISLKVGFSWVVYISTIVES